MKKKFLAIEKIENWFIIIGGILVVVLMILTIIDTTGRYMMNIPLKGNVELSEILLVILIGLSLAGTQREDGNVSMQLIMDKLKNMKRPIYPSIKIVVLILSEAIFLIALYYLFKSFMDAFNMRTQTTGPLYIILWPVRGMFGIGILFLCIRIFLGLLQSIELFGKWGK